MIDVLESDGNYSCKMMEKIIPIIAEKLPFILNNFSKKVLKIVLYHLFPWKEKIPLFWLMFPYLAKGKVSLDLRWKYDVKLFFEFLECENF